MRKVNDVCYFIKNSHFGKCVIEKSVTIQTKDDTIIQYEIRPYGLDKPLQIHADNLYNTFEEARQTILKMLEDSYNKQIEVIKNEREEKFNDWEAKYQEAKKQEKSVDE